MSVLADKYNRVEEGYIKPVILMRGLGKHTKRKKELHAQRQRKVGGSRVPKSCGGMPRSRKP